NSDTTLHSKPFDLHDGEPHVFVASYHPTDGKITVMVDGLDIHKTFTPRTAPRNLNRLLLGSINGVDGKYFTGDIAELHLYPETPLNLNEMETLSQSLMYKYGIQPIPTGNTVMPEGSPAIASSGFEVSSGATLAFPVSDANPYTLVNGQTLSGGGAVRGTVAVGNSGQVDIGTASALALDDLRLIDGAVVCWNHTGGAGETLAVNTLSAAGSITIQIVGGSDLPPRVPVISYENGTALETATWQVLGGKWNTRAEVNTANQTIDLVTPAGILIRVR
ncbi:MAG: hypothetical protein PHU80_11575, partial [Kiritimatiellae bacterium]|nr:hypothetical protein [Kiritimatiellia bacterium]